MDANKGVPVTVSQVEPETEYEGTVFDQTVIVDLPDGSEMGLFDKDVLVSDDMVGKQKRILISTLTNNPNVEQTTERTKGVYPCSEDPHSWDNHVYSGSVDQIMRSDDSHYKMLLDVGIGEIIVRPSKEQFPDLEVGNSFRVTAIRSDIYDVGNSA